MYSNVPHSPQHIAGPKLDNGTVCMTGSQV